MFRAADVRNIFQETTGGHEYTSKLIIYGLLEGYSVGQGHDDNDPMLAFWEEQEIPAELTAEQLLAWGGEVLARTPWNDEGCTDLQEMTFTAWLLGRSKSAQNLISKSLTAADFVGASA